MIKKKKGKGGRPSKYQDTFPAQARKLALLGATDGAIANFFNVNLDTVKEWKNVHPEFSAAIKAGKDELDSQVIRSLYFRATGYSKDAEKIFCSKEGRVTRVKYTEHYPPDATSMIFWLKNRRPHEWREKQDLELSGKDGAPIVPVINISLKK